MQSTLQRVEQNDYPCTAPERCRFMASYPAGLVDPEFFQQQFIGDLLQLERDEVPNVRMALARMLAAADLTNLPNAVEVLHRLSKDQDRYGSSFFVYIVRSGYKQYPGHQLHCAWGLLSEGVHYICLKFVSSRIFLGMGTGFRSCFRVLLWVSLTAGSSQGHGTICTGS